MQRDKKEYNPDIHESWRALTVKQPYATRLVTPAYERDGNVYAAKSIEIRSKNTKYRGDLLICSSATPEFTDMPGGVTLGIVELYDVVPVEDLTPEDWQNTRVPILTRDDIPKGYGWKMRNPRRVIEMPMHGQLGIYRLFCDKGDIMEYPRAVVMDYKGWKILQKEIK